MDRPPLPSNRSLIAEICCYTDALNEVAIHSHFLGTITTIVSRFLGNWHHQQFKKAVFKNGTGTVLCSKTAPAECPTWSQARADRSSHATLEMDWRLQCDFPVLINHSHGYLITQLDLILMLSYQFRQIYTYRCLYTNHIFFHLHVLQCNVVSLIIIISRS